MATQFPLAQEYDEQTPFSMQEAVSNISTRIVPVEFFREIFTEGIVLYEPCGGIGTCLQAALRNGWRIRKFIYQDTSQAAKAVMTKRLGEFSRDYGSLFPNSAWQDSFSLPDDIEHLTPHHLKEAGVSQGLRWVVCCGSPCTGFSQAGKKKGLEDKGSKLLLEILKIIAYIQRQACKRPVYILENAPIACSTDKNSEEQLKLISKLRNMQGQEVIMDAAQFGALSHRCRSFWTNLLNTPTLRSMMQNVVRQEGLMVNSVLKDGWTTSQVKNDDIYPFYPCNKIGRQMSALPTFTKTIGSRAFRDQAPGLLVRHLKGDTTVAYREPDPEEKAICMGFSADVTNAPGVTTSQRHALIGNAINLTSLSRWLALIEATAWRQQELSRRTSNWTDEDEHDEEAPQVIAQQNLANSLSCNDSNEIAKTVQGKRARQTTSSKDKTLDHWRSTFVLPRKASTECNVKSMGKKSMASSASHDKNTVEGIRGSLVESILNSSATGWQGNLKENLLTEQTRVYEDCMHGARMSKEKSGLGYGQIKDTKASPLRKSPPTPTNLKKTSGGKKLMKGIFVAGGVNPGSRQQQSIFNHQSECHEVPVSDLQVHELQSEFSLTRGGSDSIKQAIILHSEMREEQQMHSMSTSANCNTYIEVFNDEATLAYLKTGEVNDGDQAGERRRILKRATHYVWNENGKKLFRKLPDGTLREVPQPTHRRALVQHYHEKLMHFGRLRTENALSEKYWWHGLREDVKLVINQCLVCARVKAAFNANSNVQEALRSLPVKGFLYRWGLDYCKPTPRKTKRGNARILILVEHYTRYIILVPTPDKSASITAQAFTEHVLAMFGAPGECITDRGTEFQGEFDQLLHKLSVDHRTTKGYSPQGNGLAEKAVQMVKAALAKSHLQENLRESWDEHLWKIALAYNSTAGNRLGYSPFLLMFAQKPTVPGDAVSKLTGKEVEELLKGNDKQLEKLAADVAKRSSLLSAAHIHAGLNLAISQHQDYVRYMNLHEQGHASRQTGYRPGEKVLVWQKPQSKLEAHAKPIVLKVVETLDSGVVMLQGADGALIKSQAAHLAPCPVQVHDDVDIRDRHIPSSHACRKCGSPAKAASMLLCDQCNSGWHIFCLNPPLTSIPAGSWYCPECTRRRAALTAEERLKKNVLQNNVCSAISAEEWTQTLSSTLHYLADREGLHFTKDLCEQIAMICKHQVSEGEEYPQETEEQQESLLRSFQQRCTSESTPTVAHVTRSDAILVHWIRQLVEDKLLPEAQRKEDSQLWLVKASSRDLMMTFALLMDTATRTTPIKLALYCKRQTEERGLFSLGSRWTPLLQKWAIQGRLKLHEEDQTDHVWMVFATSCYHLQ